MAKTTVVIPNYNGIGYLEACIRSVLESTVKCDILVVDNGSSDGSREMVKKEFPEVTLIEFSKNTGFCHAVNAGITESKTEYVMLLNNDTTISPDAIELLEKQMDSHKKIFSVQAKMVQMSNPELIDSAGDFYCALGWAYSYGKDKPSKDYFGVKSIFSACGGAALYRKKVFDEIGLFDENHFCYLEDVDIGYRARIFGYLNYVCLDSLVYHAGSGASGSRYNEFKVTYSSRNSVYLIYKNIPIIQFIFNLPLILIGFVIKTIFFYNKKLGKTYVKGLFEGMKLSFSEEGRKHKVKYSNSHLSTYIAIEVMLIYYSFKRFF